MASSVVLKRFLTPNALKFTSLTDVRPASSVISIRRRMIGAISTSNGAPAATFPASVLVSVSILSLVSKARPQYFIREGFSKKYALLVGRDRNELRLHKDQFWVEPMKEAFRSVTCTLKSLFEFLAEQPSQLKHIEWPSFATTLKTATFTLVLVGLLIVALSSVDAALWYLLALLLRKSA